MFPVIPFAIWFFILCGLWFHRSVVSVAPNLRRSASADLESLESCEEFGGPVTEFESGTFWRFLRVIFL